MKSLSLILILSDGVLEFPYTPNTGNVLASFGNSIQIDSLDAPIQLLLKDAKENGLECLTKQLNPTLEG